MRYCNHFLNYCRGYCCSFLLHHSVMYPGGFNCLNDPEAPSGVKLESLTNDDLFGVVKKVVCICIGIIVVVMLFS